MTTHDVPEPITYRPKEAAQALGISRSHLHELTAAGQIKTRRLGRAVLIERAEIERFVADLPQGGRPVTPVRRHRATLPDGDAA